MSGAGSITLITGCMFAGKTTALLGMAEKHEHAGQRVFSINHSRDDRYGGDPQIVSHSQLTRKCVKMDTLSEAFFHDDFGDAEAVLVDEGQFFPDLAEFCTVCADKLGKHVYIAALSSDYKRECFPEVAKVMAMSDAIIKMDALCMRCHSRTPAHFSLKLREGAAVVGGSSAYEPVCRHHYLMAFKH